MLERVQKYIDTVERALKLKENMLKWTLDRYITYNTRPFLTDIYEQPFVYSLILVVHSLKAYIRYAAGMFSHVCVLHVQQQLLCFTSRLTLLRMMTMTRIRTCSRKVDPYNINKYNVVKGLLQISYNHRIYQKLKSFQYDAHK